MLASRADLLRPLPSLTDVRNRTPAADEELRCMSNHLVNKALLRPIEPGVPPAEELGAYVDLPSPCGRRPAGFGLFPRSTLRGKCWPASCLALCSAGLSPAILVSAAASAAGLNLRRRPRSKSAASE